MRKAIVAFITFILAVFIVFGAINYLGRPPVDRVAGSGGSVSLRGVDWQRCTAETDGWQHYPNRLLEPADFAAGAPEASGEEAPFGSYRLVLEVPAQQRYLVGFNSVEFATRVYINGQLTDNIGTVADSESDFVPARSYCHYVVEPQNGSIELVLQYANFHTGFSTPPVLNIGLPKPMFNRQTHLDLQRFSVVMLYACAFLLYFGIYLFNLKRRENLFFALTCLLLALREGVIGEQFWAALLPNLSWARVFVLQYVAIGLLVVLLFAFIVNLFPFLAPKRQIWFFYAMCALFLLVVLFTRASIPNIELFLFLGFGSFVMLYILVQLARRIRSLPPNKLLSAFGVLALFLAIFNDILHHFHLRLGPIGAGALLQKAMLVFIFIQVIALFLQFMKAEQELGKARQKEAELAAHNETLRRIDKERTQFLSNVTHELKTPLTVVSNYAQLTRLHQQQQNADDGYVAEKMVLITSVAKRMSVMVDQLTDVARIDEGRMEYRFEVLDAAALVDGVMQRYFPILNKNRNKLVVRLPSDLPPVRADAGRMEQVLVNLITNAVKFTYRGTITVAAAAQQRAVHITVADTGSGMDAAQLARLFRRYSTGDDRQAERHGAGTGLGLYISREIIRAHGGDIEVRSAHREGTEVHFWLPTSEEDSHGEDAAAGGR